MRANASKHKAMSYGRMRDEERRLSGEIASMCDQAARVDEAEDVRFGAEWCGDELPEELAHRQGRLEKIRAAKARLETAQRDADEARGRHPDDDRRPPGGRGGSYKRDFGVPEDRAQSNFTDPDSRIMNTSEGYQQCYNGQLAVADEFQVIIANELTANASDQDMLLGMMDQIEDTLRGRPARVLADAGYRKEDDFAMLEGRGIDAYISLRRESKAVGDIDAARHPATGRMAQKLATAEGKACYRERKHLSESANGWIKHVLGFGRFSLRRLKEAAGEWDLIWS